MDSPITPTDDSKYSVNTPVFSGPLDLLLQLIERAELDITKIAIAQVTDQFLAHLDTLRSESSTGSLPPEYVSSFLVIASRLIQIKSEVLLPRPPTREPGEEDPGEALALQLRLYKRFKELAAFLHEREQQGLTSFIRLAPPPKIEGRFDLSEIGLRDLLAAAENAFSADNLAPVLDTVVAAPRITIREKINHIARLLRSQGQASFLQLFQDSKSRLEIVVTFLAMLELVKQHFIHIQQDSLFGEIYIESTPVLNENLEIDLEFGE